MTKGASDGAQFRCGSAGVAPLGRSYPRPGIEHPSDDEVSTPPTRHDSARRELLSISRRACLHITSSVDRLNARQWIIYFLSAGAAASLPACTLGYHRLARLHGAALGCATAATVGAKPCRVVASRRTSHRAGGMTPISDMEKAKSKKSSVPFFHFAANSQPVHKVSESM